MSENKHSGKAKNHNKERISKHPHPKNEANNREEEKADTATQGHEDDKACAHPHEVNINIPDKKEGWTIGNIISAIACVATVAYFIATVFILKETKKTANIADSTFKETRIQFELLNKPWVEIVDLSANNKNGKVWSFGYNIKNLGNYPVKILDMVTAYSVRNTPMTFDEFMNAKKKTETGQLENSFISKDIPTRHVDSLDYNYPDSMWQSIKEQKKFIFYIGYMKYQNLITHTFSFYKWQIKFIGLPIVGTNYIINDNVDSLQ